MDCTVDELLAERKAMRSAMTIMRERRREDESSVAILSLSLGACVSFMFSSTPEAPMGLKVHMQLVPDNRQPDGEERGKHATRLMSWVSMQGTDTENKTAALNKLLFAFTPGYIASEDTNASVDKLLETCESFEVTQEVTRFSYSRRVRP
jgi:hypothetical protein